MVQQFECLFCDYKGMNGLMHVRDTHPMQFEEWKAEQRKQPVEHEDPELGTVTVSRLETDNRYVLIPMYTITRPKSSSLSAVHSTSTTYLCP